MTNLVYTERRDHVLEASMRLKGKRNAVDRTMADALDAALNRLDDDPELWVGILTATSSVFSAGSGLNAAAGYMTERGGGYSVIRDEGIRAFLETRRPQWTGR